MSQNKALDTKTEIEVVSYIARGDSYDSIINLLASKDISVTKGTLTNIKKRNSEALEYMQSVMVEQSTSHATSILRKSRQLLENKLDKELTLDEELAKLEIAYNSHELDDDLYWEARTNLIKHRLTVTELNSVTKESFNQSQVEQGKPSSITENPTQARANLQRVLNAIAAGDDKAAIDAIFLDA